MNQVLVPVTVACGFSTLLAGNYTLLYSVTNSHGLNITVTRFLAVVAACLSGERFCQDKVLACCVFVENVLFVVIGAAAVE